MNRGIRDTKGMETTAEWTRGIGDTSEMLWSESMTGQGRTEVLKLSTLGKVQAKVSGSLMYPQQGA